MSKSSENELDLEKLFLPAWAQEPASVKRYAHYEGRTERPERKSGPGGPGGRRFPRRDGPGGGERPRENRGPRSDQGRPGNDRRPFSKDRPPQRDERREAPLPLPDLDVNLMPEETGVEFLARQIKTTGRAYPLFDIARLILQKPDRYIVTIGVTKKPDGQPVQPLFACALDDTLWLSEDEAVAHVLKNHFATFYQAERTATEPPKGTYTFVAQCGISGVILGPPNHHDYQNQLRKLHTERFSRMPFDAFKARVKIVRDEAVVKKWVDDLSWKTEYICLNVPEALRLTGMEAVEKHFRDTHKDAIIKQVESHKLSGTAARNLRSPGLSRLVRQVCEDQKRFPLQIATVLSQQFAGHALQFFKVNKTITHVSVARPHFLDLETTPVSEGIRRIVEFINSRPKSNRRVLVETISPSPPPAPIPVAPPAVEGQAPTPPPAPEPTAEQTAVISDLHWLIHQGHVIEFANGILETAKKPLPRPPKPESKPKAQPVVGETTATTPTAADEPASPAPAPTADSATTIDPVAVAPEPIVQTSEPVPAPAVEPANPLPDTVADSHVENVET